MLFVIPMPGGSVLSAPVDGDLRDLKTCIDDVSKHHEKIQSRMPHEVFTVDRKLYWMGKGIVHLEENYGLLKSRVERFQNPLDALIVANAVESCHRFSSQFASRAFLFQFFLINLLLLIGVLTLRMFLSMVPGTKNGVNPAHASLPSDPSQLPSDQPASRNPDPR